MPVRPPLVAAMAVMLVGCIDTDDLVFGGEGGQGAGGGTGGGTTGPSYAEVILSDLPLAYWPLDVVANGTFTEDATGHGYDAFGTSVGMLTAEVPGAAGYAVSLADGAELVVDTPHPFGFASASYSLEAWVRLDGGAPLLWSCNPDAEGYRTFAGIDNLSHKRYETGSTNAEVLVVAPLSFAELRHVVFVYDAADRQAQWFVDGAPATPKLPVTLDWSEQIAAFSLGRGPFEAGFTLTVDEVAVYDDVLASDRIEAHYLCGAEQQCE